MLILMYSTHFGAYGGCDVKYPSCVNSIGFMKRHRSQNSQKIHFSNYFYKIFQNCILLDTFFVGVRNISFISSVLAPVRHLWNDQLALSAVPVIQKSTVNWNEGFRREAWQEDHFERYLKYFGGFPTSKSDFPPKQFLQHWKDTEKLFRKRRRLERLFLRRERQNLGYLKQRGRISNWCTLEIFFISWVSFHYL